MGNENNQPESMPTTAGQQPLIAEPLPTLQGPIQTTFTVVDITTRDWNPPPPQEPVRYVDFHLKPDHAELREVVQTIRVGMPLRFSPQTHLGKFVKRFGHSAAEPLDLNILRGARVIGTADIGDDGFWDVDRDALLPEPKAPEQQTVQS